MRELLTDLIWAVSAVLVSFPAGELPQQWPCLLACRTCIRHLVWYQQLETMAALTSNQLCADSDRKRLQDALASTFQTASKEHGMDAGSVLQSGLVEVS